MHLINLVQVLEFDLSVNILLWSRSTWIMYIKMLKTYNSIFDISKFDYVCNYTLSDNYKHI